MKNAVDRKAIQTMVRTYGQTPKQLFRVQHPPKKTSTQPRMSDSRQQWGPQYKVILFVKLTHLCIMGVQWLLGKVLDLRPKGRGFEPHRFHCIVSLSKNINPSLVLFQPRKTCAYITERLLM